MAQEFDCCRNDIPEPQAKELQRSERISTGENILLDVASELGSARCLDCSSLSTPVILELRLLGECLFRGGWPPNTTRSSERKRRTSTRSINLIEYCRKFVIFDITRSNREARTRGSAPKGRAFQPTAIRSEHPHRRGGKHPNGVVVDNVKLTPNEGLC